MNEQSGVVEIVSIITGLLSVCIILVTLVSKVGDVWRSWKEGVQDPFIHLNVCHDGIGRGSVSYFYSVYILLYVLRDWLGWVGWG